MHVRSSEGRGGVDCLCYKTGAHPETQKNECTCCQPDLTEGRASSGGYAQAESALVPTGMCARHRRAPWGFINPLESIIGSVRASLTP